MACGHGRGAKPVGMRCGVMEMWRWICHLTTGQMWSMVWCWIGTCAVPKAWRDDGGRVHALEVPAAWRYRDQWSFDHWSV